MLCRAILLATAATWLGCAVLMLVRGLSGIRIRTRLERRPLVGKTLAACWEP